MLSLVKPNLLSKIKVKDIDRPNAALGCKPAGRSMKSKLLELANFCISPPVVITMIFDPAALHWLNADNVSSVFPEYDEAITNVLSFTHLGIL